MLSLSIPLFVLSLQLVNSSCNEMGEEELNNLKLHWFLCSPMVCVVKLSCSSFYFIVADTESACSGTRPSGLDSFFHCSLQDPESVSSLYVQRGDDQEQGILALALCCPVLIPKFGSERGWLKPSNDTSIVL